MGQVAANDDSRGLHAWTLGMADIREHSFPRAFTSDRCNRLVRSAAARCGRQIPIAYLHRLIPWGIAGYVINVLSGICFFTAETDQYIYNPSFQLKILSMSVA